MSQLHKENIYWSKTIFSFWYSNVFRIRIRGSFQTLNPSQLRESQTLPILIKTNLLISKLKLKLEHQKIACINFEKCSRFIYANKQQET